MRIDYNSLKPMNHFIVEEDGHLLGDPALGKKCSNPHSVDLGVSDAVESDMPVRISAASAAAAAEAQLQVTSTLERPVTTVTCRSLIIATENCISVKAMRSLSPDARLRSKLYITSSCCKAGDDAPISIC
ncbi:MAG: hypothetical protein ACR2PH_15595 [Desulfobulbia bacterium]